LKSTQLNLEQKQIDNEGAKVIGEILKLNSTLAQLDLQYNQIGVEGAKVVFESLSLNSHSIKSLS